MRRKLGFIGIIVLISVLVLGCTETQIKATIKNYEITDFNGRPAIKVNISTNISTNKYPIEVNLLGPDRRALDFYMVESQKDIPVILYFGLSGLNVKPGTYYLVLKAGTETLKEKELKLQGPKLQLTNIHFKLEYDSLTDNYKVDNVKLTLKNVGDCPAYVYYIELTPDDKSPNTCIVNECKKPILQGKSETYTVNPIFLELTKGKHTIRIRVSDFYGTVIGDFKVTVNAQ